MFITAKVQNSLGEVLDLMGSRDRFVVESIQGLNPPPATLNMSNIYGMDGARANTRFLNTRNIVLTMRLRGDQEASRQELYRFMSSKDALRFFFQNNNRNVYIDGIVETTEDDMFVRSQSMQVSIICPDPFFRDVNEHVVELQNTAAGFTFPFSIDQDDPIEFSSYEDHRTTEVDILTMTETPFELFIEPLETLPYWTAFRIQNLLTGEKIGQAGWPVALDTFEPGDVLYINTDPFRPQFIATRGTAVYNRIPAMDSGSTFFQLHPGQNVFGYNTSPGTDASKIRVTMKYRNLYRGV